MRGARDGGVARARRERRVRAWARHCAAAWRGGWALGHAAPRRDAADDVLPPAAAPRPEREDDPLDGGALRPS
eukprot:5064320-Alexandrium_andersonii.AAC.1